MVLFETSISRQHLDYNNADAFFIWGYIQSETYNDVTGVEFEDDAEFRNHIYRSLGDAYLKIYSATGRYDFLVFSLNEYITADRQRVLADLSINRNDPVFPHISRIRDRQYSPVLFEKRPFEAADVYLFHFVRLPEQHHPSVIELLRHWTEQLPRVNRTNPLKAQIMALTISYGYYRMDMFEEIFPLMRFLPTHHELPVSHYVLNSFKRMAYSLQQSGYFNTSLGMYRDYIIPLVIQLNDTDELLKQHMDYANALLRHGFVLDALANYEFVYNYPENVLDERWMSALYNNLAISYLNTGKFSQYIELQLNAYDKAIESNDIEFQFRILRNLFIYHRRQNEHDLALQYLNHALALADEHSITLERAGILTSLGVYQREVVGDYYTSEQFLKEALSIAMAGDQYINQQSALIELSQTHQVLGNFDETINLLNESVKLANVRDDQTLATESMIRLASVYLEMGLLDDASSIYRKTDPNVLQRLRFDMRVMGFNTRLQIAVQSGLLEEALEIARQTAPEIIEWISDSADLQTGHMRMDSEFTKAFGLIASVYIETGNMDEAIGLVEGIRNITRSGFYNNPVLKSRILSEDEILEDYILSNQIQRLRNELREADGGEKIRINNLLLEATNQKNRLKNKVYETAAGSLDGFDLKKVQATLGNDRYVLYINVFGDDLFLFIISRSGVRTQRIEHTADMIEILENAIASVAAGKTDLHYLHSVYLTYFSALNIPEGSHVFVIPDGRFYRLPLEILPVSPVRSPYSYGSAKYLIEQYSFSYLNSLADLLDSRRSQKRGFKYDFAAIGISDFSAIRTVELSPLPYAETEVKAGSKALTRFKRQNILTNTTVTEGNFRHLAENSRILHIATHSEVVNSNPLFSTIYLHGNNEVKNDSDNGLVFAYELFELDINSELIVLSSCDSGAGGYLMGSGVLGFSRAVTYAGAQSLILNLWPVRDYSASVLTREFYRGLNRGMGRPEALRKAQLHYINFNNSDPALWGSWVLYGNVGPVRPAWPPALWALGSLFVGLMVLAGYLVYKKRLIV